MNTETHIRSDLGEHQVDRSADDVVAPCSVVVSIRLLRKGAHAFADARPLRVGPGAPHLGDGAEHLNAERLVRRAGDRGSLCRLDPGVEVWDPRVVFQNSADLIKLPERNLRSWSVIFAQKEDVAQHTCLRGGSGFPWFGDPGFTTLQYKYTTEEAMPLHSELNSVIL